MKKHRSQRARVWACILGASLCAALPAHAQRSTTSLRPQGVNRGAGGARSFGGTGASGPRQYYPNGEVGEATISSDPETRRLIVITDDETSQFVSQVITNLDRPKPQVLIKVVFLEVTYRKGYDVGIEGGFRKPVGDTPADALGANVFGLSGLGNAATSVVNNVFGLPVQSFAPVPPGAGLYQIATTDYQVTFRAIATAGKTEVLSRPSILARNNQQAVITVGQEVPFLTSTRFDTGGNQINTVQYQDVGIILRVTPFITTDGKVELIVSPEISNLTDQTVPVQVGVSAPVIAKRSADTVVVTGDGQTVIIGGLMQNQKTEAESKIPVLGDLPVLGFLFRRTVKDTVKTELIIFLTPHVVSDLGQLAGLSAQERSKSEMIPKAIPEQELNRFLDSLPTKDDGKKPK